jgi:uncharacterized protein (TIGR00304 family)
MSKYYILSLVFFICGVVIFAIGVLSGEVETGFVVVFPFLVGSGIHAFLGFICVFIAILLFMFGFVGIVADTSSLKVEEDNEHYPQKKTSVKGGGVVLIGPIPIVFGSSWKIAVIMIVLVIILIITAFFAFILL